jgi:hypothetical protein
MHRPVVHLVALPLCGNSFAKFDDFLWQRPNIMELPDTAVSELNPRRCLETSAITNSSTVVPNPCVLPEGLPGTSADPTICDAVAATARRAAISHEETFC